MKAWKKVTGELFDIQTYPNPLPEQYNSEEWALVDVTEAEIAALVKVSSYKHSLRGIAGLLSEVSPIFNLNLENIL